MTTSSAVLLLVFNRPDTTKRVFEAIRAARPPRLYVAADGPRSGRPGEAERCEAVRAISSAVDWPCQFATLFRAQNLGCKRAVSSALDWFFKHESEGIVLEDDCLPDPSFFPFCDQLLDRYRGDTRVSCISGDNFISQTWQPKESYYFSRYVHIWGWATWRRAWQHYDVDMTKWRSTSGFDRLRGQLSNSRGALRHWTALFDRVADNRIDTWDYQWTYATLASGGLCCMPRVNLISNIGFGTEATHTVSPESKLANLPALRIHFPLEHPATVEAATLADDWTERHVFDIDTSPLRLRTWMRRLQAGVKRTRALLGS